MVSKAPKNTQLKESKERTPNHSELTWQLIKKTNCFIVKKPGTDKVQFSSEKGNLMNKNSYKYSGLAQKKTLDISAGDKDTIKVSFAGKTSSVKKADRRTTAAKVSSLVLKNAYRKDLHRAALARASKIQSIGAYKYVPNKFSKAAAQ